MDYAAFDAIMREGIIVRCILPAALAAATLIGVVWYIISKHRNGIASDRSLGFILVMAAALVLSVIISIDTTMEMIPDLQNQSYAVAHGEYELEITQGRKSHMKSHIIISITTDDGEGIGFRRPIPIGRRTSNGYLSEGEYTATVWYGVESHCIVAFIPDEPILED